MHSLTGWDSDASLLCDGFPRQPHFNHERKRITPLVRPLPAIQFSGGQFSGSTVHAELHEIQTPQFGRRFGAVDRRVLDDPPVVLLRLFVVHDLGTDRECLTELQDYSEVALSGLMCMADLFEVPEGVWSSEEPQPVYQHMAEETDLMTVLNSSSSPIFPRDALAVVNGHMVTGRSNCTRVLFGTKFVEPHKITLGDRTFILFTFSDLAVQLEGHFILRYRFFDLFSVPKDHKSPRIQAECYGGPFKIYSTKEAPPLKMSTPLTMCLHSHGVRVNFRPVTRKSRKRSLCDESQGLLCSPGSADRCSNSENGALGFDDFTETLIALNVIVEEGI